MEQRLSIITLGVSNLKKSRAFYEGLGWKVATEKDADNIVAFNLQSFVLALYPITEFSKELGNAKTKPVIPTFPSFTLAYNVNSEKKVDLTIKEAKNIGAKILKTPQKVFWGGYSGYFCDPDGYMWEVSYNPFASLSEDGSFKWVK